ncbi:MAG: trypsin-like peptidase domain-containing protein [Bacteriovoracaceae bacterium]|nr:trypsin-like peptidase domain-containing protein [Bacteriovoracaceae bacterium]
MKSVIPTILLAMIMSLQFGCGKQGVAVDGSVPTAQLSKVIIDSLNWMEVVDFDSDHVISKNASPVADLQIPATGGRCTGFMITPTVLMTNEHCVPRLSYARGLTATFGHHLGASSYDQETFDCSTLIGVSRKLDFALLSCVGAPGDKYGVVELTSRKATKGEVVYVIQQNCDYYENRSCDWTKKVAAGYMAPAEGELAHNADTLAGSSGSPLFSTKDHKVIGIHHMGLGNNGYGRGRVNTAVPMEKIVPVIIANFPDWELKGL